MPTAIVRNAKINYEVVGDGGPWVALSPGGRRGYDAVQYLAERIAGAGFRVLLHDRRNCGASFGGKREGPGSHGYLQTRAAQPYGSGSSGCRSWSSSMRMLCASHGPKIGKTAPWIEDRNLLSRAPRTGSWIDRPEGHRCRRMRRGRKGCRRFGCLSGAFLG